MVNVQADLYCESGHKLFTAAYRSKTNVKVIRGRFYCPKCDEYYGIKSKKMDVVIK